MDNTKIIDKEERNKNNNKNNKFICEICGSSVYKSNKIRHEQTNKHNDIKYLLTERFEISR